MIAQQQWAANLSIMQQSVLFAAVRAPDGIRKDHPVKVLMRWYRRCLLLSAFDRSALLDPFLPGGGSFTGPFTAEHASEYRLTNDIKFSDVVEWWRHSENKPEKWALFNGMREVYLRHVDELPHHFQLHFMHAAEIVGYKHSNDFIAEWWRQFYFMIVNDAHLFPETAEQMDKRLGDNENQWREREEVMAL